MPNPKTKLLTNSSTWVGWTCVPHFSSGHFMRLIDPSLMCNSKKSLRHALQNTWSHSRNRMQAFPGFSVRQTSQQNIVRSKTRPRLVRSQSSTIWRFCSLSITGDLTSRNERDSAWRNPIQVKRITDPALLVHIWRSSSVKCDNWNVKQSRQLEQYFLNATCFRLYKVSCTYDSNLQNTSHESNSTKIQIHPQDRVIA